MLDNIKDLASSKEDSTGPEKTVNNAIIPNPTKIKVAIS